MSSSPDAEPAPQPAFVSAVVTEHFVLQSAASTTVTEALGRSSLYLSVLSSGLITLGFVTQNPERLPAFGAFVLPTVFLLGLFTTVRLVDTGVQNIAYLARIARIRRFYRGLAPAGTVFFGAADSDEVTQALASQTLQHSRFIGYFTVASMIATINAAIGGAAIGLFVMWVADAPWGVATGVGAVAVVGNLVVFHRYQNHRYRTLSDALVATP